MSALVFVQEGFDFSSCLQLHSFMSEVLILGFRGDKKVFKLRQLVLHAQGLQFYLEM